jgi:hypothetical protein
MVRVDDTVALDAVPVAERPSRVLLDVCSRPEFSRLLGARTVAVDTDLERPFAIERTGVRLAPAALTNADHAAITVREALELSLLEEMVPGVDPATLAVIAHVTALGYLSSLPADVAPGPPGYRAGLVDVIRDHASLVGHRSQTGPLASAAVQVIEDLVDRDGIDVPESGREELARWIGPMLPLALPAEVLFVTGGDHRQRLDPVSGRNSYGIPARPLPWALHFSSCTASVPSLRAYRAADELRRRLLRAALTGDLQLELASSSAWLRSAVVEHLGLGLDEADVVLMPSGTDVELIAAAYALSHGRPVTSVVVAPAEVGSGTLLAAAGRHFSTETPSGAAVEKGESLAGFDPDRLTVVGVPVRESDGSLRSPEAVESEVDRALAEAVAADRVVVLHLVDGSKTGVRLPRTETVSSWQDRFGSDLIVVVDAAQVRVDQRSIAEHVRRNRLVFATGSKFYAGPPFSAALLSPAGWLAVGGGGPAPVGLGEYLDRWSCPPSATWLTDAAGQGCNLGLLLRWHAALAEMSDFHSVAPSVRDEIVRGFALGVLDAIDRHPRVELVPSPWTEPAALAGRGLDELPTIFTFKVLGRDGRPLTIDAARRLQRTLQRDLSVEVDGAASPRVARSEVYLGQPVAIGSGPEGAVGGLRFALGAPTVSDIVFGHHWGPSWQARLARAVDDVQLALEKIDLVVESTTLTG